MCATFAVDSGGPTGSSSIIQRSCHGPGSPLTTRLDAPVIGRSKPDIAHRSDGMNGGDPRVWVCKAAITQRRSRRRSTKKDVRTTAGRADSAEAGCQIITVLVHVSLAESPHPLLIAKLLMSTYRSSSCSSDKRRTLVRRCCGTPSFSFRLITEHTSIK